MKVHEVFSSRYSKLLSSILSILTKPQLFSGKFWRSRNELVAIFNVFNRSSRLLTQTTHNAQKSLHTFLPSILTPTTVQFSPLEYVDIWNRKLWFQPINLLLSGSKLKFQSFIFYWNNWNPWDAKNFVFFLQLFISLRILKHQIFSQLSRPDIITNAKDANYPYIPMITKQ